MRNPVRQIPNPSLGGILFEVLARPWVRWVGKRYLKSKKDSKFLSMISLLSTAGVALGVTAMIVVLSVMDGFETELKKRLMATDLHVLVTPLSELPEAKNGLVPPAALESQPGFQKLKDDPRVKSVWPIVSTEVIFKIGRKVTGVVVKGVNEARFQELGKQLTEKGEPQMLITTESGQPLQLPGVYIGQELAHELFLIPGDRVTLISPIETEGPTGNVPRTKQVVVEGIYKSGLPEQELHTVFARDTAVLSFLRKTEGVSQWEIVLQNFEQAPEFAKDLRGSVDGFRVRDWMALNEHLFRSLRLERMAMFVMMAFIVIVASFNIVTTLTLMVLQKKREMSILKAVGAKSSQVSAVFLYEGLLIGGTGVGLGTFFGWLLCDLLKRYEFIRLPEVYYDRNLPVHLTGAYVFGIAGCALFIVLLACVYPARRAARLSPIEGIRLGV